LVISSGPAQVSVPNVVGDTQAVATSAITGVGLVLGTVTTASSATVASGDVISQSPTAATGVNIGSAVNLVLSTGPAKVAVPNVVGSTQAAATSAITTAGLVLGTVTTASSSTVASGSVISESPAAGTSVNVGSAVNVVISSGPAQVSVPNVVGDTQASATSAITGVGLVVGTVTTASSTTVASGDVISESPAAGAGVNIGSAVNLVISTGASSTGPASVQVNLSAQVVAWAGSVTVNPVALDGHGNPINNPSLQFTITVTPVGATSGNAPLVAGDTITFPKLNKQLINAHPTLDPNGVWADTNPSDPNYGKQTGGVYLVTATINGTAVAGSSQVVCLPTGTATVTAQTYSYAAQLNAALNQIVTAYGNTNHSGLTAAKAVLQTVLNNPGFNEQVLSANQVVAPADGAVITPDLLTGFPTSPDDAAYATTLASLIAAVQNATAQINAITPSNPTMAQVLGIESALTTYQTTLTQFNALKPSAVEIATLNDQVNELLSTDIPTLLDAISSQVSATLTPLSGKLKDRRDAPYVLARAFSRMHIAPQFFDIFAGLFGACIGLEGQALNNIVTLSVALVNDVVNLEAAGIINKNAPPGMSIDDILASSDVEFACPAYPNTEVDAFGLDPNPANDPIVVVGAVNGGILGSIASFSVPNGIGQIMSLLATIYQTGRDIGQAFNIQVVLTPDQFILGGGLFGDGADAIIFNNGWPQTNQSPIPAVGLVIITNKKAGGFAATNIDLLPSCGG
jgi:beta-lactam-binding protein with PASTA domain